MAYKPQYGFKGAYGSLAERSPGTPWGMGGSLAGVKKKSALSAQQSQAMQTAILASAAPLAGAGADVLGEYIGGDIESKGEAFGRGALKGGAEGALTGAALGTSFGPVGTAIGAGVGFLAGGLMEGLSTSKQYEQYKKTKKAHEKQERFQRTEAQAAARRMSGGQSIGTGYRPETIEGADTQVGTGLSSFDAYKASRYGG